MDNNRRHSARIISRKKIANDTYEITFESVEEINFVPGQYAWVIAPVLSSLDLGGNRRAFSIASSPQNKKKLSIILRARLQMSGYKQTLLEMPIGAEVILEAPFGHHSMPEDPAVPIVLVAGGVGIASFMSMIRDIAERSTWRDIALVYANNSPEDAAYIDELSGYAKNNSLFKLIEVIGEIKKEHFANVGVAPNTLWYVAGPQAMLDSAAEIIISRDVDKNNIIFEEFFPSFFLEGVKISYEGLIPNQSIFETIVEGTSNHIVFTDANGTIIFANKAAQQTTGYSLDEMRGRTPRLWGGLLPTEEYKHLWETIKKKKEPYSAKITNRKKNGELYTVIARISPIISTKGELLGFVGTEEDITALEKMDEAKTQFVSFASHQLRSPIAAISWYMEILLAGEAGKINAQQKKYLNEVYDVARQMADLISILLDVSRIELGTFAAIPAPTDIVEIAHGVLKEIKPLITKKKIVFKETHTIDLPEIESDHRLLRIIFQNLLTNAVKYTPPRGHVNLRIEMLKQNESFGGHTAKEDSIIVVVSDDGQGIPAEEQSKIFSKFFRASNAVKVSEDGTGLGLYIASRGRSIRRADMVYLPRRINFR